jgi:hypothetical protein
MLDSDFDIALAAALERRLRGGTAMPVRPSGSDTGGPTLPPTQLRKAA